jgi:hypothetical protein
MNISDYSIKVKNLANVFACIKAPIDDENLVVVTLNGLGKYYSQFRTSIAVRETFFDFQNLITLLINEEIKIVGTSSNGRSYKKCFFIQVIIKVKVEVLKLHFEVNMEARMVNIINIKVSLMEVDKETLEEEEVVEVEVEIIEVNNQITIQTAIVTGNLGTWKKTIIKRSMMHEMESYNKGIMHQLPIKVMNNCL